MPIIKAGLAHNGFALIDVISPCVSFNDHEGSTKSYKYTREHEVELTSADYVPLRSAITLAEAAKNETDGPTTVRMHDGSLVRFRNTHAGYDPTNREEAWLHVRQCQKRSEVATGVLFIDRVESPDNLRRLVKVIDENGEEHWKVIPMTALSGRSAA